MKKQKRRTTRRQSDGVVDRTKSARRPTPHGRRKVLENIGFYTIAAGLLGSGGWYIIRDVQAGISERNLSLLGNGIPTVVQIHDPQCPRCRALQRETRSAISEFEDGTIQYLVADIRQPRGRSFAARHGVGHITLLLFDGSGRRLGILAGERKSAGLVDEFRELIRASGMK